MGAPLVAPETLASWLGLEFDDADTARAGTVIQMVSGFARAEAGQDDWKAENVPEDVALIVLLASVRCWSNPDLKTSVTHDDVTRRWEAGQFFDESQLRVLRRHRPGSGGGLSSVRYTTPSAQVADRTAWFEVEGGRPVGMYRGRGY